MKAPRGRSEGPSGRCADRPGGWLGSRDYFNSILWVCDPVLTVYVRPDVFVSE
jgi:hypothetical protein